MRDDLRALPSGLSQSEGLGRRCTFVAKPLSATSATTQHATPPSTCQRARSLVVGRHFLDELDRLHSLPGGSVVLGAPPLTLNNLAEHTPVGKRN